MNPHRYILEPYKGKTTRHHCPQCNDKRKTFALYIDTETNKPINEKVGRCDRLESCFYHYKPKEYFTDNNIAIERFQQQKPSLTPPPPKPISFIEIEKVKATFCNYDKNDFVKFLENHFGEDATTKVVERYLVGTSKRWSGATIFYQCDINCMVRTGKIMLYSAETCKRIKEPDNCIDWIHTKIKSPDYNLMQCLFGEHLLKGNTLPIAITESEKTAIISSLYYPDFIWLATGGLTNLNTEKCKVLKGRKVVLFPDLKAFDKWNAKNKELHLGFEISDYLERIATDEQREGGEDLGDFLLRLPPPNRLKDKAQIPVFETIKKSDSNVLLSTPQTDVIKASFPDFMNDSDTMLHEKIKVVGADKVPVLDSIKKETKEDWSEEIKELQKYFDNAILPPDPITLNQSTIIKNAKMFIERSLFIAMANNGNAWFRTEIDRLIQLKELNELRLSD